MTTKYHKLAAPLLVAITLVLAFTIPSLSGQRDTDVSAAIDYCFATIDGSTIYSSVDASAVQQAVDAAEEGDLIKVAGTCTGVLVRDGITQTVYISKSLTLQGGYIKTDWNAYNPARHTKLDADRSGRVITVISGTVTLDTLNVTGGEYYGHGGGIYNEAQSLTLINTKVISNIIKLPNGGDDQDGQGAGLGNWLGMVFIYNSEFKENWAQEHGGAINNDEGVITIDDTRLHGNTVLNGDGGCLDSGGEDAVVTMTNSACYSNTVGDDGGGIWAGNEMRLVISNSKFLTNTAVDKGGAVICSSGAQCDITNSTFAYNQTGYSGGGLYVNNNAQVTVHNSTFSGNQITHFSDDFEAGGGGVTIANNGWLNLDHTSIVSNSALSIPGKDGVLIVTGTLVTQNSLFAYNGRGNPEAGDFESLPPGYGSVVTSTGYNLCSYVCGFGLTATGDQVNVDPLLAPLARNGGDNQTHALLEDSPAFEAIPQGVNGCGTPFDTDQRGVSRPQGVNCDIGAFEALAYILDVSLAGNGEGTVTGDGINCGSDCSEGIMAQTAITYTITLTATAELYSTFTGWSGDCTGVEGCTVTMDANKAITATFIIDDYSLFMPVVSKN